MERSLYKMLSTLRLPETRVCLVFAVLVTLLVLLNKHLIQDPFSQKMKATSNISSDLLVNDAVYTDDSVAAAFVEKHCDLQGIDWYPEDETNVWQQRAPYFLLIGGEKVESSILADVFRQHPNIITFPVSLPSFSRGKMRVKDARSLLYNQSKSFANHVIGFDSALDYLFLGSAPYSILCMFPWIRVIVLVQDPINRIVSSWNFYKQKVEKQVSFSEWIDMDMKSLRQNGVVNDWNSTKQFSSFSDSAQLNMAWRKYSSDRGLRNTNQPVGRSLYSIQLRNWFNALHESGFNPKDKLLIARVEDMENRPAALYQRLTDWLHLPPYLNVSFPTPKTGNHMSSDLTNSTRLRLKKFFKPYNEQVYNLLQGEWKGLWDENSERDVLTIWPPLEEHDKETNAQASSSSPINSKELSQPSVSQKPSKINLSRASPAPNRTREITKAPSNQKPSKALPHIVQSEETQNLTGIEAFAAQWCDVQGGSHWFPNESSYSWQARAPYFYLMGAKWSGASLLTSCIMQHPLIAEEKPAAKEFFLAKNFRKFVLRNGKTKVFPARTLMYARHYNSIQRHLKSNSSFISFDATLGYLFASSQIQKILCVTPWTKFVVILRDPVEQAYSIWADAVSLGLKLDFDEWVAADIQIMRDVGLIHDWANVSFDGFVGSQKEEDAWFEYQQRVEEGAVGRGMYEIQLRLWFRALEAIGRNPTTEVLILRAESLSRSPQFEFSRIVKFLKLPDQRLESDTQWPSSNYSEGMADKTRHALKTFYAPYSTRLIKLIGNNPNWGGKWKDWLTK